MTRKGKRLVGRPSLGDAGHTKSITIKLSELEYDAITVAVRELGPPTTVSSWIRDHALEPLKTTGHSRSCQFPIQDR